MKNDPIKDVVNEIMADAMRTFPDFFRNLGNGQINALHLAASRIIRQGARAIWRMDAEIIRTSVVRNWNGVAMMIIGNLKDEEANNTYRIITFIGKCLAYALSLAPVFMVSANPSGGDEE
jgi:hypothetical protein